MKKLITIFLFLPFISHAKGLWLGGKLGLNIPTANKYVHSHGNILLGGKAFISLNKIETGVEFEVGSYGAGSLSSNSTGNKVYSKATYQLLQAFCNYKAITKAGFDFYTGLSVGIDFGEVGDRRAYIINKNTGQRITSSYGIESFNNAPCIGIQTGVHYYITDGFRLQAEIGARTPFIDDGNGFSYAALYFPISFGISARLFKF
jgi:hypothetical protein